MPAELLLIETAADELARVDAACAVLPEAIEVALRLVAAGELAGLAPLPVTVSFPQVAAAEGDPLHDTGLPGSLMHWRVLLQTEEDRVRSGATLNPQRFAVVAPTLTTYPDRHRLEAIWRTRDDAAPVLHRLLDAAAWSPDRALGEATAALLLCAERRATRARLLLFADIERDAHDDAIAAWRDGKPDAWLQLGLSAAGRRAGAVRRALDAARVAFAAEPSKLDGLGRAAINARRALELLHERFVTSMPRLARQLTLSRPAAGDALERLHSLGIVREMTGRGRDRVFAYAPACVVAESIASSASSTPG